jgi:N-terminal half of MaoC dehydratase
VGPLDTLITDEMRAIVDKVMRAATSFPIAASDIRKWAMAVYYPAVPPRLYWDEEYARASKWGGIVAPQEFNPFAWMAQDPQPRAAETLAAGGYRRFTDLEAPFGIKADWAHAILQSRVIGTYSKVRMRPGDVIRSETAITEYFEREGKMGLQLYTTVTDNLYNQNGDWIKRLDTVFLRWR